MEVWEYGSVGGVVTFTPILSYSHTPILSIAPLTAWPDTCAFSFFWPVVQTHTHNLPVFPVK
jgi:hypothetical protein